MIRRPRFWFALAGCWLLAGAVAHFSAHVWLFVLESGMGGLREFAVNAMKQVQSPDPLRPSLWRQFRAFSLSFGFLMLFAGLTNLVLARTAPALETLRAFALLGTLFWTGAFLTFAMMDPVIQPMIVALIAVPLHAIAYLVASLPEEAAVDSNAAPPTGDSD